MSLENYRALVGDELTEGLLDLHCQRRWSRRTAQSPDWGDKQTLRAALKSGLTNTLMLLVTQTAEAIDEKQLEDEVADIGVERPVKVARYVTLLPTI